MVQQLTDLASINFEEMADEEIDAALDEISSTRGQDAETRTAEALIRSGAEFDNRGGFVTIYDTLTGMPSQVLYYMLSKTLKYRRTDDPSKRVFSMRQLVPYVLGNLPCILNPDHPMRPRLIEMGLGDRTCRKHNLRTSLDVRRHALHRHKEIGRA